MSVCCFGWLAPRGDVLVSAPVHHVCTEPTDHTTPHLCGCGRWRAVDVEDKA